MPADLPGFYYDVTRNRYFPLASRQASSSTLFSGQASNVGRNGETRDVIKIVENESIITTPRSKRKSTTLKRVLAASALSTTDRREVLHEVLLRSLERPMSLQATSNAPFEFHGADLTCIAIDPKFVEDLHVKADNQDYSNIVDDHSYLFAGDKVGMLYTASRAEPELPWSAIYHMSSQISSVHIYNNTMLAASFGPNPQIFIARNEYMSSLNMHAFHDIWTVSWITSMPPDETNHAASEVSGTASAVIGMKQRAAYMPSLETHRGSYLMPTSSDVFSVYKHHSAVITGARNGSIKLFDIRAPPSSHVTLFPPCVKYAPQRGWDSRPKPTSRQGNGSRVMPGFLVSRSPDSEVRHASSVTNLHVVDDWGLLVGAMDGTLAIYDMRYCSPAPSHRTQPLSRAMLDQSRHQAGRNTERQDSWGSSNRGMPNSVMTFSGHVNSCSQGLGFYVAPSSGVIFAAGEDHAIRAWSLRTGNPIRTRHDGVSTGAEGELVSTTANQAIGSIRNHRVSNKDLLSNRFDRPVTAIVPARGGRELWVASGREVFRFQCPIPI
ncbi:hypothetical protein FRC18_011047 [Serendipita sp. 400]|nr:hypothetical protein FRC18_011047 [Serendipita sp. 400]